MEAPAVERAQKLPGSFCNVPPSTRRTVDIIDESHPAEPGRVQPPAPRLREEAHKVSVELPMPVTKQPVRFVTPVTKQPVRFVTPQDSRGGGFLSLPWEPEATREAEDITRPGASMPSGPLMASRWPELAERPPEDDEPWRAAGVDAERRRRLDLEQRGKPWSE